MATQGTAADSCMGTEFHLGVLLVHSIGTQPPLDTLVRWTDALIEVINLAKPDSVGLPCGMRALAQTPTTGQRKWNWTSVRARERNPSGGSSPKRGGELPSQRLPIGSSSPGLCGPSLVHRLLPSPLRAAGSRQAGGGGRGEAGHGQAPLGFPGPHAQGYGALAPSRCCSQPRCTLGARPASPP
jgi:hypothetical protein